MTVDEVKFIKFIKLVELDNSKHKLWKDKAGNYFMESVNYRKLYSVWIENGNVDMDITSDATDLWYKYFG